MGNRFAIQGLGDEATHGRQDDKTRRTGSGWRPSDPELADERILTNTSKSSEAGTFYIMLHVASVISSVCRLAYDVRIGAKTARHPRVKVTIDSL